jgi:glycosyltransferase involved in cell wall biosynthesis
MSNEKYFPKISIVIPAYNASNYLADAIDSALAQTYKNVEIIVVNDGSQDDGATERVALSYGDKIRYFYKENGGSSSALNVGIANMEGEWFSWLSHDDLYLPQKLEQQVEYMNSLCVDGDERSRHIFFAASELIDATGRTIKRTCKAQSEARAASISAMPHNGYLIAEPTGYIFHGCTCLIHRDAFTDLGYFNEKLRLLNDVDLWYRLYSANYRVHFVPEVLVQGRVHGAQVSKSIGYSYHNSEQDMYWNRSLDWLVKHYPQEEKLFYRFARNAYLKNRNAEGNRAFAHIKSANIKKNALKTLYKSCAFARNLMKKFFLVINK